MTNLFPLFDGGLSNLQSTISTNWVGPIFIIVVGAVGITFLVKREIRKLIIFLVIAAIVGVLVYGASGLFGSSGALNKSATNIANNVNVIMPLIHAHASNVMTSLGNFIH